MKVKHIRDQAAERGIDVPVGRTAGELRDLGWEVSIDVGDDAVLVDEPCTEAAQSTMETDAPSPHTWRCTTHSKIRRLTYIWDHILADPEYADRLYVTRDDLVALIDSNAQIALRARVAGHKTVARYFDMETALLDEMLCEVEEVIRCRVPISS